MTLKTWFYPVSLIFGLVAIFLGLFVFGLSHNIVVGAIVLATLIFAFAIENKIPKKENAESKHLKRDLVYTLINLAVLMLFGPFVIVGLSFVFRHLWGPNSILATQSVPFILLQSLIVFLGVDLLRYAIHRMQHRFDGLWKFHSQHHEVQQIYSLNNFYSHPLDLFIRHGVPGYIAAAIGFKPIALGIGLGALALIGIFSHCNADFDFKFLNKYLTTNQVHEWHHSDQFGIDGKNYAPALCFWDRIFGTYYFN